MKRKSALYFAKELQSGIDDLMKDFVYIDNKKLLRVLIPKEWRGRAIAFADYVRRTKRDFEFRIDSHHPSLQYSVKYHSLKDNLMFFSIIKPELYALIEEIVIDG